MAVQNPFFGKRDTDTFSTRTSTNSLGGSNLSGSSSNAVSSGNSLGASSLNTASTPASTAAAASAPVATAESGGSKLTVGPNIKLKGVEITDCDTLVVEGTVEATMDSRVIQIAEQGAFHGSAEIDLAEIRGEFSGNLTVRQKLTIYSTGKVSGKIRYGKVVIEEGGQLSGEIEAGISVSRGSSTAASTAAASSYGSDKSKDSSAATV